MILKQQTNTRWRKTKTICILNYFLIWSKNYKLTSKHEDYLSKLVWTKLASSLIILSSSQFTSQKYLSNLIIAMNCLHFSFTSLMRDSLVTLNTGHSNRKCISSPKTPNVHLEHKRSVLSILAYLPISILNLWDEVRRRVMSLLNGKLREFKYFSKPKWFLILV